MPDPITTLEPPVEVSIVMPCLNEADTLATYLKKARRALDENQIVGEIIVADNGSTDGSQKIATDLGARVVPVPVKGYGNALMGGIAPGFDEATVRRVVRLIDFNEYKRRQAAPGLKVTSKAFGVGRRIPIAQRYREI